MKWNFLYQITAASRTPDYGATAPRSPFSLSSVLNWICWTPPPPNKIPGYAIGQINHYSTHLLYTFTAGQCVTDNINWTNYRQTECISFELAKYFNMPNCIKEIRVAVIECRSQWSRGLRRGSAAALLPTLWVRIPPLGMSVCLLWLLCVVR